MLLFVVFVGMGGTVLAVVQGKPREDLPDTGFHDTVGTVVPALFLLVLVLLLGVWVPPQVEGALRDAASYVEMGR